ncbi:MAG: hypothetical protein QW803_11995 [Candidatus Methanomethylicia archaeon]
MGRARLILLLLCLTAFIVITVTLYNTSTPKPKLPLTLMDLSASILPDGRYLTLIAHNTGDEDIELESIFINGSIVFTWLPSKTILKPGENATINIFFYWNKGEIYNITVKARSRDGAVNSSGLIQTPLFSNILEFNIINIQTERIDEDLVIINVNYTLKSLGYSKVYVRLFTFMDYVNISLPIYAFYDYRYMSKDTLNLIDSLIEKAWKRGLNITRADWISLETLARNKIRCILIVFSPLSSVNIPTLTGSLPACIIDPNRSQGITDDSRYGKSLIYDWMRDYGLIFVTVGSRSSQSNRWILYDDGYAKRNLEKFDYSDACIFFTDANEIILKGGEGVREYLGSKIAGTLGLHTWRSDIGFSIDDMIRLGIDFYSYATWRFKVDGTILNLSMPCFIRVGKGGWLCLDNTLFSLHHEAVINDLISMIQHSPWNKLWYPMGWMYDSSYIYENGYNITKTGNISLILPKPIDLSGKLIMIVEGYDEDSYKYITIYKDWSLTQE